MAQTTYQFNQYVGALAVFVKPEGNMITPTSFDASAALDILFDFRQTRGKFGVPRFIYVNNKTNPSPIDFYVQDTGQPIPFPPYSFGYVPILAATENTVIRATSNGGATENVYIAFMNWDIDSPGQVTSVYGPIVPGLESKIYGRDQVTPMSNTNPLVVTQLGSQPVNRNTTLAAGVAANVVPAPAAYVGFRFRNTGAEMAYMQVGVTATGSFAAGDKAVMPSDQWTVLPYNINQRVSFYSANGTSIEAETFG